MNGWGVLFFLLIIAAGVVFVVTQRVALVARWKALLAKLKS